MARAFNWILPDLQVCAPTYVSNISTPLNQLLWYSTKVGCYGLLYTSILLLVGLIVSRTATWPEIAIVPPPPGPNGQLLGAEVRETCSDSKGKERGPAAARVAAGFLCQHCFSCSEVVRHSREDERKAFCQGECVPELQYHCQAPGAGLRGGHGSPGHRSTLRFVAVCRPDDLPRPLPAFDALSQGDRLRFSHGAGRACPPGSSRSTWNAEIPDQGLEAKEIGEMFPPEQETAWRAYVVQVLTNRVGQDAANLVTERAEQPLGRRGHSQHHGRAGRRPWPFLWPRSSADWLSGIPGCGNIAVSILPISFIT